MPPVAHLRPQRPSPLPPRRLLHTQKGSESQPAEDGGVSRGRYLLYVKSLGAAPPPAYIKQKHMFHLASKPLLFRPRASSCYSREVPANKRHQDHKKNARLKLVICAVCVAAGGWVIHATLWMARVPGMCPGYTFKSGAKPGIDAGTVTGDLGPF